MAAKGLVTLDHRHLARRVRLDPTIAPVPVFALGLNHTTAPLDLPVDGRVWNVDFDDWMYLIDDKVMLNRSAMRKFGFHLGDVTLSFTRR